MLRQVGFSIFGMVVAFMMFFAVIFIVWRNYLPILYINDTEVIEMAASLHVIAGLFQLSDGLQVVGLGALRGLSDVKVPTFVTMVAYWVVGLPLGYVLAFWLDLEALGVWIGLLIGLTLTAIMLLLRFHSLSLKLLVKYKDKTADQLTNSEQVL
jgi:MATE family multidrug resistance protein